MRPNFDIAGRGKMWFIISLLVIIPGLISMGTCGFNFGSGTIMDLKITLRLGVLLSMFTAITLTQFMLKLLVNARIFESPLAYGADGFVLFESAVQKAVKR